MLFSFAVHVIFFVAIHMREHCGIQTVGSMFHENKYICFIKDNSNPLCVEEKLHVSKLLLCSY